VVAPERAPLVNIGAGSDLPIAELAALTAEVIGFRGEFVYDSSKPDGTPRKLMDSSRMAALGWKPRVGLREGIALAYEDFRRRFSQAA
jgi:GDP-L-fucose synthase